MPLSHDHAVISQALDDANMPADYAKQGLQDLVLDLQAAQAYLSHEVSKVALTPPPDGSNDWWSALDFRDRLAFAEAIGRYRRAHEDASRGPAGSTLPEGPIG